MSKKQTATAGKPKVPTGEDSPYLKVHKLCRLVQQGNRFISSDLDTDLGISESFILLEIDSKPGQSGRDLAETLELDKSTVSRHLKSLSKHSFVDTSKAKEDSRLRLLKISKAGKAFLKHYDKVSDQILNARFKHLNKKEQGEIADFVHLLADGYGTSRGFQRKNEHLVRSGMRRLTRSFGILKPSFMGSDLNTTQWQLLSEIVYSPDRDTVKTLSDHFSTAANTVSVTLRELERRGYLDRSADVTDKRKQRFNATPEGKSVIKQIEQTASSDLEKALGSISSRKLFEYIWLLEKFAGSDSQTLFGGGAVMQALTSPVLRSAGRTFLVESLVKKSVHHLLDESVFGKDSYSYALFKNHQIIAAAEARREKSGLTLVHFATEFPSKNSGMEWQFLEQFIRKIMEETDSKSILIPSNSSAPAILGLNNKNSKTLPKLWKEILNLPSEKIAVSREGWLIPIAALS